MSQNEYVLGTDQQELARLQRQHELWAETGLSACQQSGFAHKQTCLDLGCGPGFTTMSLLKEFPAIHVTSVDASEKFLRYLKETADNRFPGRCQTQQSYLENLDLKKTFEAAYSRWILIFVSKYEEAIQKVAQHLQPGSPWILEEYVAYETMSICPEVPIMRTVVDAIFASWHKDGGDPNRGRVLPSTLEKHGFKIKDMKAHARITQPGQPLWDWPDEFYRNFIPRLVAGGFLNLQQQEEFFSEWDQVRKRPGSFFLAPTMMTIVAEKIR